MTIHSHENRLSRLTLWGTIGGLLLGVIAGLLLGVNSLIPVLLILSIGIVVCFFINFEKAVLVALVLRSSLDIFTLFPGGALQQIPAISTAGLIVLTLLFLIGKLIQKQSIQFDTFACFFVEWIVLQSIWIPLMALGGLGLNNSALMESIYEWIRLASWVVIYVLVMQLKDRVAPEAILNSLFISLIAPASLALLQIFMPSKLPSFLIFRGAEPGTIEAAYRVNGTFGHPNSFAVYLILFIALTFWKAETVKNRWKWFLLMGFLLFLLINTRTMVTLAMLAIVVVVIYAPKLNLAKLMSVVSLFSLVIALFGSTELGQKRLGSLANTPLFNPNIDVSRAILLSQWDYNSFNWRISQWTYLLHQWQEYPVFGYGLGISYLISTNNLMPHNDYVKALVEGGFFGFVLHLLFLSGQIVYLVFLLREKASCKKQYNLCLSLLAVVLATGIGMLTENILICTAFYFYFWIALAVSSWDWNYRSNATILISQEE